MNTNDVKDMIEVLRSNGYACLPSSSISTNPYFKIVINKARPEKTIINIISLFLKELSHEELVEFIKLFKNSKAEHNCIHLNNIPWPEGLK
jgi:hypothetical protein